MRLPNGVESALHCAWLLALLPEDEALSARRLAEFYGLPEAYLAKLLKTLVRGGLFSSATGPRGGFCLGRPASDISVLDIVEAIEGSSAMFRCLEIRQRGPVALAPDAYPHPCGIAQVMCQAENAWRDRLAATTIAELVANAGSGSTGRARKWLTTVAAEHRYGAKP